MILSGEEQEKILQIFRKIFGNYGISYWIMKDDPRTVYLRLPVDRLSLSTQELHRLAHERPAGVRFVVLSSLSPDNAIPSEKNIVHIIPNSDMVENINHPSHYGGDTVYEAIKVIEAWSLGFNLGNTVKYISRAGKKENLLEDLKKAKWYLEREISNAEKSRK